MADLVKSHVSVTGSFLKIGEIAGSFSKTGEITGILSVPEQRPVAEYDGSYAVTPTWDEQRLMTEGKKMNHDIRVYEIPIFETTNPSGGTTVIIGG